MTSKLVDATDFTAKITEGWNALRVRAIAYAHDFVALSRGRIQQALNEPPPMTRQLAVSLNEVKSSIRQTLARIRRVDASNQSR